MAILVTGGAGYIGSHTVVELLNLGKEVVIVDNLSNSSILVLDRIEAITGQRPAFYELDVCDKQGLRKVFEQESIEAAIHFAGYKAVGESVQKPVMYYENNIMSTLALVEVMSEFNVKRLYFHRVRLYTAFTISLPLLRRCRQVQRIRMGTQK